MLPLQPPLALQLVTFVLAQVSVLVPPAETELNRLWTAQVLQPFQQNLAGKYPFDTSSRIEASATEVARVFGPSGAAFTMARVPVGASDFSVEGRWSYDDAAGDEALAHFSERPHGTVLVTGALELDRLAAVKIEKTQEEFTAFIGNPDH